MRESARSFTPLFICGMPRSGTSLFLSILDGHPDLAVFPAQTSFLTRLLPNREKHDISYMLESIRGKIFSDSAGTKGVNSDLLSRLNSYSEDCFRKDPTNRSMLECLFSAYLELLEDNHSKNFYVEKTPGNEMQLNRAAALWPDQRAVYIYRNPYDNFASYRKRLREKNNKILSLDDYLNRYYQSVISWLLYQKRNKDNSYRLCYEELVSNDHDVMSKFLINLGIVWNDIVLKPTMGGVSWQGNSSFRKKHTSITADSIGNSRAELSEDEHEYIKSLAFPVYNYLNSGNTSFIINIKNALYYSFFHRKQTGLSSGTIRYMFRAFILFKFSI